MDLGRGRRGTDTFHGFRKPESSVRCAGRIRITDRDNRAYMPRVARDTQTVEKHTMRFDNQLHSSYAGVHLHARTLSLCVLYSLKGVFVAVAP